MGCCQNCCCYTFVTILGGAAFAAATVFGAGIPLAVTSCVGVTATGITARSCISRGQSHKGNIPAGSVISGLTSVRMKK